jgi:hypothetical protein
VADSITTVDEVKSLLPEDYQDQAEKLPDSRIESIMESAHMDFISRVHPKLVEATDYRDVEIESLMAAFSCRLRLDGLSDEQQSRTVAIKVAYEEMLQRKIDGTEDVTDASMLPVGPGGRAAAGSPTYMIFKAVRPRRDDYKSIDGSVAAAAEDNFVEPPGPMNTMTTR